MLEHKQLASGNADEMRDAARSLALVVAALQDQHDLSASVRECTERQATEAVLDVLRQAIELGAVEPKSLRTDNDWQVLHKHPNFAALWEGR